MRRLAAALSVSLALAGCGITREDAPWTPLDLEAPVGASTGLKLGGLRGEPARCAALIQATPALQIEPVVAEPERAECDLTEAVVLQRSTIPYGGPVRVSCPMAAALYVWEREVVASAAQEELGAAVTLIEHFGTYSCRRVNHAATGRFSEHARANAIDVAGFRLADGRRVSVLEHYGQDGAEGRFLARVRAGGCDLFRTVLGPDYNAAHRNHLHLDMGAYRLCR